MKMNSQDNEQNLQHCSDEDLQQPQSEQTIAHLAHCEQCREKQQAHIQQLSMLKASAQQLPEFKPSPMAWDKIQAAISDEVATAPQATLSQQGTGQVELSPVVVAFEPKSKPKKTTKAWFIPTTIAASFIVGSLVSVMSLQFWQAQQLDEQIAMSRQFEHQLVMMQLTSPWVESQLWQISQIDRQLNEAKSVKVQQQLWQQRNEILKQLLAQPQNMNEMI